MGILKIKIRVTQNVGNVWISRLWGPFQAMFSMEQQQSTKTKKKNVFSLVGQWALFMPHHTPLHIHDQLGKQDSYKNVKAAMKTGQASVTFI